MANLTLTIYGYKPPSWNTFYAGATGWKRQEISKEAHWLVDAAVRQYEDAIGPVTLAFPVRVVYTIFYANERRRDIDNAAVKVLGDGLVKAGVLPDDSTRYVPEVTLRARLDRDNPRVVIEVEEIVP